MPVCDALVTPAPCWLLRHFVALLLRYDYVAQNPPGFFFLGGGRILSFLLHVVLFLLCVCALYTCLEPVKEEEGITSLELESLMATT